MTDIVSNLRRDAYAPHFTSVGAANLMVEAADEIELLRAELARVRLAHKSILNEVLYGGTDLIDEPDIDRIHDFAMVGLKDMLSHKETEST